MVSYQDPAVAARASWYAPTMAVVIRQPTRSGAMVDTHLVGLPEAELRGVLRRLLAGAQDSRRQGHLFADRDCEVVVDGQLHFFGADTDIDEFVEQITRALT